MRKSFSLIIKLLGLVKPLLHIMTATVMLGTVGYLAAIFISILGGYALLNLFGVYNGYSNTFILSAVAALAVILSVSKYLEQLSGHYIAFKLLADMRDKVFGALRKLAPAKLEGKDRGNLISVITADIELIEVFYAHTIAPVAIAVLTSLCMVWFIGSYHVMLGAVALGGYIVVGFILPVINTRQGRNAGREYRAGFGDLNSYILESLRGLREIIQFGQGDARRKKMKEMSADLNEKNKKLKTREGYMAAVTDLTIFGFGLTVMALSVHLMRQGLIGAEAIVVCTIAMLGSFGPTVALSSLSNDLLQTLASGERVLSILEEEPVVTEITTGQNINAESFRELVCDKVSFAYRDEKILDKVSLRIGSNQIIGIHGVSGSGKSTLLKLLMRFWDIKGGKISFNDGSVKEIDSVNTASLRNVESYVTQETCLFHDTIEDNIKISKPEATEEEVVAAAKKASIHDFIVSLPEGYKTIVSELGSSLSGGERQRIGVARAFLHDAPILLLDEPTSNLDSLNEAILMRSVMEACNDKSVIVVSHRKSTMNICDVQCNMSSGRVS